MPATLTQDKVKQFLLDTNLVEQADYDRAEKEAFKKNGRVEDELISLGILEEDEYRRVQANVLGIPYVSLKGKKIDFEVLTLIPEPIARNHNIVAFAKDDNQLEVAMLDVQNLATIDFIKKKVGLKISPRLTDTESIKYTLIQYQRSLKAEFGDIIEKESINLKQLSEKEEELASEDDLKKMADDLPVVRVVDTLLKHAIIQGASDIHIEPGEKDLIVRYRIDGMLHDAMVLPKYSASSVTARLKVLSKLKLDEKRLPQDGRFKVQMEGQKVSFRVSILPVFYGEKIVMRLLRESGKGFSLEGLGFHGEGLERIHYGTRQTTGMVLTTGPTGSGKTTTLYTILDVLNQPDVNISTIEDPIEYQMERVNQSQVKPEIGFSFSNGLRTLMRQDPDIIMVGEIRDQETAALAVNAALTGHLVLSTLHTNSAAGTLPRMAEMGVEPFLLVSTLKVVIGQRLVRKLTSHKEEYILTPDEISTLKKTVNLDQVLENLKLEKIVSPEAEWATIPFYRPKEGVDNDGYSGRVGIHEILKMSPAIKDIMMKGGTSDEIQAQAVVEGMMTMLEDGIFKAVQGVTTIEEVLRVVSE